MDDGIEIFWTIVWRLAFVATIVLFLLKLTRWVDWSWWYVGLPIYIVLAIIGLLFVAGLALRAAAGMWSLIFNGRKPKFGERPQDYVYSTRHIEPLESIKNPRKV